jgi:hypothetical protein
VSSREWKPSTWRGWRAGGLAWIFALKILLKKRSMPVRMRAAMRSM